MNARFSCTETSQIMKLFFFTKENFHERIKLNFLYAISGIQETDYRTFWRYLLEKEIPTLTTINCFLIIFSVFLYHFLLNWLKLLLKRQTKDFTTLISLSPRYKNSKLKSQIWCYSLRGRRRTDILWVNKSRAGFQFESAAPI